MNLYSYLLNMLPVSKNKIVFSSFGGKNFGCNPKYIAKEILRQNLPYKLVWISDKKENLPKGIIHVKNKGLRKYYELSTANVIINNCRMGSYFKKGFKKKSKQLYIQTWHGDIPLKKIENDAVNLSDKYKNTAMCDLKFIDLFLSGSQFFTKIIKTAFGYKGKILQKGCPRNDIFFEKGNCEDIRKGLGISSETKIVLYAPTFRDNKNMDCYNLEYVKLLDALQKKWNGKWIVLLRMHPNLAKEFHFENNEHVLNVTNYPDMQELLKISDVLITDYSSSMFDFLLTKKPTFIYATDIKEYQKDRGMYFKLESTPFPIASCNEVLFENILNFDIAMYKNGVNKFLEEKGSVEKGFASAECVKYIQSKLR